MNALVGEAGNVALDSYTRYREGTDDKSNEWWIEGESTFQGPRTPGTAHVMLGFRYASLKSRVYWAEVTLMEVDPTPRMLGICHIAMLVYFIICGYVFFCLSRVKCSSTGKNRDNVGCW